MTGHHPGVDPAPLAVSRRQFLAASGLAVAGTTAATAFGPRTASAHDNDECACLTAWEGVWSVARAGGKYYALAGEIDSATLEIHQATVDSEGGFTLGPHSPVVFPEHFSPATMHGIGGRLLIGGSVVEVAERFQVDYTRSPRHLASPLLVGFAPPYDKGMVEVTLTTLRPAVFEVAGAELRELPIGAAAAQVGWGVVTEIIGIPGRHGVALRIDGSPGRDRPYGERVVVAHRPSEDDPWSGDTVASGLGESWLGTLNLVGDTLVTITVDQDGRRAIFARAARARGPWRQVDAEGTGPVLGAVSGRDGDLVVLDSGTDRIRRRPFSIRNRRWAAPAADALVSGQPAHAVLTIGGSPSEWIAITPRSARIVNEAA